ncbi:DUF3857 domain-containing protein [Alteromonas sp. ASW11-36]|uniref:DUF3857 domain-containing protein n=1 Tax=Alteromonas arenosi TaxID=3055817 RepID=A0ABT7T184_9ALTE|nr:DUF3857 domain-containing protein [Alteromonas sp. ASW11-36]MDM7862203.1 DUF3857 domain-containing protein [Alteromonas sp. ASW11-36]
MKRLITLVSCLFTVLHVHAETIASGGFEYTLEPTPEWVEPVSVPTETPDDSLALTIELFSSQMYLVGEQHRYYRRTVQTIRSEQALSDAARLSLYFVPDFQQLFIHKVHIIRDGERLDVMDKVNIRLVQQESELNMGIITGEVMALILIPDARVGDQVEYAYSVEGTNTIYGDKRFTNFTTTWMIPFARGAVKVFSDRPFNHAITNSPGEVTVEQTDGLYAYRWQQDNVAAVIDEGEYPNWYNPYGYIEFTEYDNWGEVSAWAQTLFDYDVELSSDFKAMAQQWLAESDSQMEYAEKVVDFVQNDIRYVGLLLGQNTHLPNTPDLIFERRYGDCKDKGYMIALLLRHAGIDAYTALVSMHSRKGVMDYVPSPSAFDHVISVFYIDGQEYWIDGTRNFQKTGLDNRGVGDFQKGLVIRQGETAFSDVVAPQEHLKIRALDEVLTASAYDAPVNMQVTVDFEGAEAEEMRAYIASDGIKAFEKDLLNFYLRIYPNMQAVSGLQSTDDATLNRLTFTGEYNIPDYFDLSQEQLTINLFGENIGGIASLPDVKERSMPLALYNGFVARHSIRFNLPEEIDWELDTSPYVLEDASTRYARTLEAEPTHIAIQHEYEIKQDHVPTSAMANHIANLHKIRDSLYFSVWVSNPEQQDPSANQLRSRLRDALKRR